MQAKSPKVGVGVFIIKDGKFLMGKRQGAHGAGSWSVPGGHLEWHETFAETAIRETREEVGLEIENLRFGAVTNDHFIEEDKHYITIWMLSDWKSGTPVSVEPDKFIELRWCTMNTLPAPLFLPWNQLLNSSFIEQIRGELH